MSAIRDDGANIQIKKGARHDAQAAADRVRTCPRCDEINELSAAVCTSCGMVLIKPRVTRIATLESTEPAIDNEAQRPRWVRVYAMRGRIHAKASLPPSFRLRYSREEGYVSEYLELEHENPYARWYASKGWTRLSRTPGAPPPATTRDVYQRFMRGDLREPQRLQIKRDGEWWRVVEVAT